ncbi:hypothetical protein GSH05_31825 [Burkholderia pseudomallei]|uniref:hypothetical protein n=1 Tax=Burkholderia pseudomallei TaxID=28450 RepID=UPI00194035E4|nr:hypothetical protein [Burkholderia pseudomallei]MBM5656043.1 hypothetical protein [Burkholderia pseudomallei]
MRVMPANLFSAKLASANRLQSIARSDRAHALLAPAHIRLAPLERRDPALRSPRRAHPHGLKHQRAAQRIGGPAIETVAGPADPAAPAPRPPRAIRPIVSPATS